MQYCDECGNEINLADVKDCPACGGDGLPGQFVELRIPRNCYKNRKMKSKRGAVIHFMSAIRLSDQRPFGVDLLVSIFKKYKVSDSYLILRNGTILVLVPDGYIAYHAGYSIMNGEPRCNDFTFGVCLVGGPDYPFEEDQIASCKMLLGQLMTKNNFGMDWVQGHSKVRRNWNIEHPENMGSKKFDPGVHFPWDEMWDSLGHIGKK